MSLSEVGEGAQKHLDFSHDELKEQFANWIQENLGYQTLGEDLRIELGKHVTDSLIQTKFVILSDGFRLFLQKLAFNAFLGIQA